MAYISIGVFLAMCAVVSGHSWGTPDSACESMFPEGHGFPQQTTPAPYHVTVSSKNYTCGEHVLVVVSGSIDFEGFFCQARTNITNGTTIVGFVGQYDTNTTQPRCNNRATTHVSRKPKPHIIYSWLPTENYGDVHIVCTVLKQYDTFWLRIPSHVLQYQESGFCSSGRMTSAFMVVVFSCLAFIMFI